METTISGSPSAPAALRTLFQHPRMIRDLLSAWSGVSWTHWLDVGQLAGIDRRGRPVARARPPAFWKAPWCGGGDELWLLVETRCEEDPGVAFRLARRCLHLWERLAAQPRDEGHPLRLPLVIPIVVYAGAEPWRGARQGLELFWPVLPGLQAFAPRAPFLLFDLRRDPLSQSAAAGNLVQLLRALLASGSPRGVDAVLSRLVAELDRSGDEALRRTVSRYLGESFLPQRFPRLFQVEGGKVGPLPSGLDDR